MTSKGLRARVRRAVTVTTTHGDSFRGVLWSSDRQVLVLRNAELLHSGETPSISVDGELVLLMGSVVYMQFT